MATRPCSRGEGLGSPLPLVQFPPVQEAFTLTQQQVILQLFQCRAPCKVQDWSLGSQIRPWPLAPCPLPPSPEHCHQVLPAHSIRALQCLRFNFRPNKHYKLESTVGIKEMGCPLCPSITVSHDSGQKQSKSFLNSWKTKIGCMYFYMFYFPTLRLIKVRKQRKHWFYTFPSH